MADLCSLSGGDKGTRRRWVWTLLKSLSILSVWRDRGYCFLTTCALPGSMPRGFPEASPGLQGLAAAARHCFSWGQVVRGRSGTCLLHFWTFFTDLLHFSISLTWVPARLLAPGLTHVSHEFLQREKQHLCILKSQRPVLNVPML